jgi:hypothetical protein
MKVIAFTRGNQAGQEEGERIDSLISCRLHGIFTPTSEYFLRSRQHQSIIHNLVSPPPPLSDPVHFRIFRNVPFIFAKKRVSYFRQRETIGEDITIDNRLRLPLSQREYKKSSSEGAYTIPDSFLQLTNFFLCHQTISHQRHIKKHFEPRLSSCRLHSHVSHSRGGRRRG